MNLHSPSKCFGWTGLLMVAGISHAQFSASLLNPPGSSFSKAWGAYNGRQVGHAGGVNLQTAALWSGTPASAIPLTPAGWGISYAYGISAVDQVGIGRSVSTGNAFHAFQWHGDANYNDLHPAGYSVSLAYATDGQFQAGQAATFAGELHAMRWSGTAASAVDLHPVGYSESHIYAAAAGQQAGYGVIGGVEHAIKWTGNGTQYLDLNGTLDGSIINGMDSNRMIGTGSSNGGPNHAMTWDVTTGAIVDIHPTTGFSETFGYGIAGSYACGFGTGTATSNQAHALAWVSGHVIDLHSFLPSGYSRSYAYGVDPITHQIVGEAVNNLNRSIAFMWTPAVPEPTPLIPVGLGLAMLLLKRRS